jgi:hypothetical protein
MNEDILSIIFSYGDYLDYSNFYMVNSEWKYCITKYTDYPKLMKYMNPSFSGIGKNMIFYHICKNNELKIAKWFHQYFKNSLREDIYLVIFKESCIENLCLIAEYIYSLTKFPTAFLIEVFRFINSNSNSLDKIRWFYNLTKIKTLHDNEPFNIRYKCHCGNLTINQDIISLDNIDIYLKNHEDCINGHRKILKELFDRNNVRYSVILKHEKTPKYYFDIYNENIRGEIVFFTNINDYFVYHCQNNNFEIVRDLYETGLINIHHNNSLCLQNSLKYGHVDIVRYLYDRGARIINNVKLVNQVCKLGHIRILKMLEEKGILKDIDDLTNCFQFACCNNRHELASYLYSKYKNKIDIHRNDNVLLRTCCNQGLINIVRWLVLLGADVTANDNNALYLACINNNIDIIIFLIETGKFNINNVIYKLIDICCIKNNVDIIKFIVSIPNIDINETYFTIFSLACKYKKIHIIQWLFLYCKQKFIQVANKNFNLIIATDDIDIFKYVISNTNIEINVKMIDLFHKYKSYTLLKYINFIKEL